MPFFVKYIIAHNILLNKKYRRRGTLPDAALSLLHYKYERNALRFYVLRRHAHKSGRNFFVSPADFFMDRRCAARVLCLPALRPRSLDSDRAHRLCSASVFCCACDRRFSGFFRRHLSRTADRSDRRVAALPRDSFIICV